MKRCYVARYPLAHGGNDLNEVILARDTWWSPDLRARWEALTGTRKLGDPMLQAWYADTDQVVCVASTDQPYKLS
jgi:hypothetical protein